MICVALKQAIVSPPIFILAVGGEAGINPMALAANIERECRYRSKYLRPLWPMFSSHRVMKASITSSSTTAAFPNERVARGEEGEYDKAGGQVKNERPVCRKAESRKYYLVHVLTRPPLSIAPAFFFPLRLRGRVWWGLHYGVYHGDER